MTTIYKYQFTISDIVEIEMPVMARILSLQLQDGKPTIWAIVNDEYPKEMKKLYIEGTGFDIEPVFFKHYIGTVQMDKLVFHVFE